MARLFILLRSVILRSILLLGFLLRSGLVLLGAGAASAASQASSLGYNAPLDRPYSLRLPQMHRLEADQARLIADPDAALHFAWPRPCLSPLDSSSLCSERPRLRHEEPDGDYLGGHVILGEEYREGLGASWGSLEGRVFATDGGLSLEGQKGPVSFGLDARLFVENLGNRSRADLRSYDGEGLDLQEADETGSVSYASYARYRGGMALDLPFGRLEAGRDAVHWGPGIFLNLNFQQDAIPFNQVAFSTDLGPFSVKSLYGGLKVGRIHAGEVEKHLYAHRYEWRFCKNAALGLTEQLFLVEDADAFAFIPVFPLFIAKTLSYENENNGNLSADLALRYPGLGMIYGEFLLDDLESPSSLFTKRYQQNKWALLLGGHLVRDFGGLGSRPFSFGPIRSGLIAEYSRVEPWVYTHFADYPAQASNLDRPLGNPYGPNSQVVILKVYGRWSDRAGSGINSGHPGHLSGRANASAPSRMRSAPGRREFYAGLKQEILWKGTDPGSRVDDPYRGEDHLMEKRFIAGVEPRFTFSPEIAYTWPWLRADFHAFLRADLGDREAMLLRLEIRL